MREWGGGEIENRHTETDRSTDKRFIVNLNTRETDTDTDGLTVRE